MLRKTRERRKLRRRRRGFFGGGGVEDEPVLAVPAPVGGRLPVAVGGACEGCDDGDVLVGVPAEIGPVGTPATAFWSA